ncbi:hypothetical protein PVK06_005826 [Gossypium arboreum]|uniref:Uncharacterized protein n=1 Tax=Gossypium arboreum TaxID=29729 RepID=A0ABR0QVL5_GOSAR|nr:hypothetical protein PVK06_005826 [Gossypium arboreum]
MVKERLDQFVFSSTACSAYPYIDSKVTRQSSSDHKVIMFDTLGKKPKEKQVDLRLLLRFEACGARDERAKKIVKDSWCNNSDSIVEKMICIHRRKKNDINRLKDNNGYWVYNNSDKCHVARDYFIDLFQTSTNTVNNMDICFIPKCVSEEINKNLTKSFTNEEIFKAFNQMGPRNALGIDGLPEIFFKEN